MRSFALFPYNILNLISERLGRIERDLIGKKYETKTLQPLPLNSAMEKKLSDGNLLVKAILLRDGCASIKNVLSPETCDSLLKYINKEKLESEELVESGKVDYDRRFGAVNNRRNRADMFLPYSAPIVQQALHEAVRNMKPFLLSLADMETTGTLHELSCIISDPGAL